LAYQLGFLDGRGVHERARHDAPPQAVTKSVRHAVIDRHVLAVERARRHGPEVGHAVREGPRHRQPAGVRVVFHVVQRSVRQHNGRPGLADDRGDPAERLQLVQNLQVIADRRVPVRAEDARRRLRFLAPNRDGPLAAVLRAAATAVADIEVVRLPAGLPKQEQGSGNLEFDVVRVGNYRDGVGHSWNGLMDVVALRHEWHNVSLRLSKRNTISSVSVFNPGRSPLRSRSID